MTKPKYDLTVPQAVAELKSQLRKMQSEPDREQLKGTSPDTAFEQGYAAALFDLEHYTGPDPKVEYQDAAGKLAREDKS